MVDARRDQSPYVAAAPNRNGYSGGDLLADPFPVCDVKSAHPLKGGGGGTPAFEGTLSEEEIGNVAAYVVVTIVGK